MNDKRIQPFRDLLRTHRSAAHPLFSILLAQADNQKLTQSMYGAFRANLVVRTMLTLPEIHASCIQASLDLDPIRTAFGVMTGAEEGGFGRPDAVHTVLMMRALNNHGRVAFDLAPLDLKLLMAATRLLYASTQLMGFASAVGDPSGETAQDLRRCGIFDSARSLQLCAWLAARCGYEQARNTSLVDVPALREYSARVLSEQSILPETIDYCFQQLAVITDPRPGYIQGVSFAHEGLADGMIFKLFAVVYAGVHRYRNEAEFIELVYPYFRAHGDYLRIIRGGSDSGDGVEAVHAIREFEKLAELDDEMLATAWIGATDFADRNARVWDGILNHLSMPERA